MNAVRVLVVEDNRALAENIEELFQDLGAEVHLVEDAASALAATRALPFDLCLVDMRLPGSVSGLELVPALREHAPHGELILMTGNATLGSAIEAVRHGIFAYLQKPFDPEDLMALGERALAQAALRKERSALARELARSESLHRAVVESVESLIIGMDEEHRIRMWNRSAQDRLGWDPEEVLGRNACEVLLGEADRGAFHRAARAAKDAGMATDLQLTVRTRDPRSTRVVRFRVMPLSPEGASVPLVLAVGTDVTVRLALEARAAEAEAMAALGRLTAGLAHEIRNPLNAASLQLELMARAARRVEDAERGEKLERRVVIVKDELQRLSRLLDEFLGLARPGDFQLEPVSVRGLLEDVAQVQRPVAEDAGLELTWEVDGDPELHVRGDAGKLKQALVNLIVNAVDAMREQGHGAVRVRGRALSAEEVELRVEDEGEGLSSAEDPFRPFVTTKQTGTGLGLPIVKKIAELHGGVAEIALREAGGTVARLRIPRDRPEGVGVEAGA